MFNFINTFKVFYIQTQHDLLLNKVPYISVHRLRMVLLVKMLSLPYSALLHAVKHYNILGGLNLRKKEHFKHLPLAMNYTTILSTPGEK